MADHLGHQHVAADDREVRWRILRRRLLHQPQHLDQPAVVLADAKDAVAAGVLARHLRHRHHVAAGVAIRVGKLAQARHVRQHQIVGQQDRERVVADEGAGAPDGVAQPQRHLLAHRDHRARLDLRGAQHGQRIVLAALAQRRFQLVGDVEMFHQRGLAAPGDHAELLDAGRARLLDRVLDQRLVDYGQHFLGHRLGGGQETCAEAGDGQNGLAQWLDHDGLPWSGRKPADATGRRNPTSPAGGNVALIATLARTPCRETYHAGACAVTRSAATNPPGRAARRAPG